MNSIADTVAKLKSVNWDFDYKISYDQTKVSPFNCRKYHSYPATFIPEIPYSLIEILSQKGDHILDPFGGIGTTFMQALLLERYAWSYDINFIASMVCYNLYWLFDPQLDLNACNKKIRNSCKQYNPSLTYGIRNNDIQKNLSDWFQADTYREVLFLLHLYESCNEEIEKRILEICLSDILTTTCSQKGGWAYIADNVKPKPEMLTHRDAIARFLYCVDNLCFDIGNIKKLLPPSFFDFYSSMQQREHVFNEDFMLSQRIKANTIDLVITSPPYPRMIDYVKSQRLSYYFEGRDFREDVRAEIGARMHRGSKSADQDYLAKINNCNDQIFDLLKSGGYYCCVLPDFGQDSNDKRKPIIDSIIEHIITSGFNVLFEKSRYIPSGKRDNNIQFASLINEKIYVFRKA